MTFSSRCDTPPEIGRYAVAQGGRGARRERSARHHALADFVEDIGILFRYATGRDYYDRRLTIPKD